MASPSNPQCFPSSLFRLSQLYIIMTGAISVTGSAVLIQNQYRGVVGGNVTFYCPVDENRTLGLMYIQRGNTYVNGYYIREKTSATVWSNTRIDTKKGTMHMSNLNVSHQGDYQCYTMNSGNDLPLVRTDMHLSVTGNYSEPALTMDCCDESPPLSCLLTCVAHGGYPQAEVKWNVSQTHTLKFMNNITRDNVTKLVNTSSTARLNCSNGEMFISCSVGNLRSELLSICKPKYTSYPPWPHVIIIAVLAAGFTVVMVVTLLWWKSKKCKKGEHEDINEDEEEGISLN
ncbi:butyrophilin subfamily 3 member A3 [Notothenia coriiceps]|uniref:Butyrophilin subfamily 3 member A3 n=1 Tax=Notothenia coriiceps TaxID=8208 RepID=A0A6I9NTL3_9TELE|nr:PREDICTED: butyrophilin subfamily 3 member A3-like [Notothenia coriiceps]